MIDLHVLQLLLTSWFITMLGITSDSTTKPGTRRMIRLLNVGLVAFVLINVYYSKQ